MVLLDLPLVKPSESRAKGLPGERGARRAQRGGSAVYLVRQRIVEGYPNLLHEDRSVLPMLQAVVPARNRGPAPDHPEGKAQAGRSGPALGIGFEDGVGAVL